MNYESILAEVLNNCDEREKERIMQEDELFQRRGWCKMIEFLCGLIEKTNGRYHFYYAGSSLDSYLIYKFAELQQTSFSHLYNAFKNGGINIGERLLNGEKARSILFIDVLRITIDIAGLRASYIDYLIELNKTLEELICETGLRKRQALIDPSTELLVLSNDEISDSDLDVVLKEKKDSTPEEIEVLHKMLIISINLNAH